MDAKELLAERTKMIGNVFEFEHNDRVPIVGNFFTWPILDEGYKFREALYDYELLGKLNAEFFERYQFDAALDLLTRNPFRVTDALGGGVHHIDSSDESISADEERNMHREDYQEYLDDPDMFYWNRIFGRYCKPGITLGEMKKAVEEFYEFGNYCGRMSDMYIHQYGGLMYYGALVLAPAELLCNHMRGMKEFSIDMRRVDKGLIREVEDAMWENEILPGIMPALEAPDPEGYVAPISIVFLAQTMMSPQQFGEFYWPCIKKVIDLCVSHGKHISAFCEGEMLRFKDYLEDIPKGTVVFSLEQDDIFKFRKELPNIALSGGMPTMLLGHGTKEECVDYAKKLIDELGDGYMLSQDKMISFRNDATRENLLAVNDFVHGYRG